MPGSQGNRDKVAALEKKNRVLESELHDAKKTIKNLEAAAGDSAGDIKKLKVLVMSGLRAALHLDAL